MSHRDDYRRDGDPRDLDLHRRHDDSRDGESRDLDHTATDDDMGQFDELTARAFVDRGELLPTTEAEVARAEHELEQELQRPDSDLTLPDKLAADWHEASPPTAHAVAEVPHLDPPNHASAAHPTGPRTARPAPQPHDLRRTVRGLRARPDSPAAPGAPKLWLGYTVAAAVGALAASVAFLWIRRTPAPDAPLISGAGNEFRPAASSPEPPARIRIDASEPCSDSCCAGSACASARDDRRTCSSGRRCIACSPNVQQSGGYRLRIGNLALDTAGKRLRDEGKWTHALELCVRAGGSELSCAPTQPQGAAVGPWTTLPGVVSAQNLLAGFELTVREQGETQPLAVWSTPVVVNTDVLCRGIAAKPRAESGAIFGTVSVFLEDAYYVELGRAARVSTLTAARARLSVTGLVPSLFETTADDDRHFVLVLGPIDKPRAERIRWQLLSTTDAHDATTTARDVNAGSAGSKGAAPGATAPGAKASDATATRTVFGSEATVTLGSDFVGEPKRLP